MRTMEQENEVDWEGLGMWTQQVAMRFHLCCEFWKALEDDR